MYINTDTNITCINRLQALGKENNIGFLTNNRDIYVTGWNSTSPCSETYGGASAESELETKALIGAITAKSGNWDAYITVHSYGQLWYKNKIPL